MYGCIRIDDDKTKNNLQQIKKLVAISVLS